MTIIAPHRGRKQHDFKSVHFECYFEFLDRVIFFHRVQKSTFHYEANLEVKRLFAYTQQIDNFKKNLMSMKYKVI